MPMFCLTLNWESKPHKMSDDFSNSFSYWCLASNCGNYLGVFLERLLSPFTCLVFRIGPHDKVGVTHSATGPFWALRWLPWSTHSSSDSLTAVDGQSSPVSSSFSPCFASSPSWTFFLDDWETGKSLGGCSKPQGGQLRQEDGCQGLWSSLQTFNHWWVGNASVVTTTFFFTYFCCSGDSGVGKSSLLVRFADNHFSGNYITTIGMKHIPCNYLHCLNLCGIWLA